MRRKKARKGFSLVELLIAIVVLAIIGGITIVAGTSAQKRARITSAMTVFDNYASAFNTAVMDHPGLVNDRADAWAASLAPSDAVPYSTLGAYSRLVGYMNKSLSDELRLVPSEDKTHYESVGNDPWGGKYVLLEYPEIGGEVFDPESSSNQATMKISIWCTGLDSDIIPPKSDTPITNYDPVEIRDYSVGVVLMDRAGDITKETQGSVDEDPPFLGATIPIYKES